MSLAFTRTRGGEPLKTFQEWPLTGQYLLSGESKIEPNRAIDFWSMDDATASWRPCDRNDIAAHGTDIEITLQRKRLNDFSGALAYVAKRTELAVRLDAQFFFEFASRRGFRILPVVQFALWNRLGAEVAIVPKRPARMHEKNDQAVVAVAVHQNSSADGRHVVDP